MYMEIKTLVSKDIEQELQTNIAFVAAKTKSQHSLGCRENTQGQKQNFIFEVINVYTILILILR